MSKNTAQSAAEIAAQIIENASKEGRRIIDGADYNRASHALVVRCGPLSLAIDIKSIPELAGVSPDDLSDVALSPGGATIKLEKHNIYIEAASLVVESVNDLSQKRAGGLIMELLGQGQYRI